ncbi:MAG: hypothetical protein J6M94_04520 [Prevotella sp.]|nr:hypothetical protein [Prevotella sp.]
MSEHTHHSHSFGSSLGRKNVEQMDDAEEFKTRMLRAQKRKKWLIKYGYRALVVIAAAMLLLVALIIVFDL